MSESKFGFYLCKTKEILKIEQKAFVLLLIKRRTFFGTPGSPTFEVQFGAVMRELRFLTEKN